MIYIVIVASIVLSPYLIWIVLFGCTLIKKLIEKEWQPKKGLVKAVAKWEQMSAEERMEVEKQRIADKDEKGTWVASPTAKEEEVAMNDKAYKEGLLHPMPTTEVQTPTEVQGTAVNLRPNP